MSKVTETEAKTRKSLNALWVAGYKPLIFQGNLIARKRDGIVQDKDVYVDEMIGFLHRSFQHRACAMELLIAKGWVEEDKE